MTEGISGRDGAYTVRPGRLLPNAILLTKP